VGMGMHPSLMCGSGAFDDALQHLGENSDKFMSNPTVEQLVATIKHSQSHHDLKGTFRPIPNPSIRHRHSTLTTL
jgi:hypothetical protein